MSENAGHRARDEGLENLLEGHATTETAPTGDNVLDAPLDPCTIVIFGATGDLTTRKLIPSLLSLLRKGGMPERFRIVGCGRKEMDDEKFRAMLRKSAEESGNDLDGWEDFASKLHYLPLTMDSLESFRNLARFLAELDRAADTGGNRIFYLALPMFLYRIVAGLLGESGLSAENTEINGWSRIVVEKPYGSDRKSAAELDRTIHAAFVERQVYRIDHYLAKETVQNILMFRFANTIFEPLWNRNYIDHVDIIAAETLGVEKRAGYYESSGILRDMFQNHMMQILALTAMEPPSTFSTGPFHDEKVKVFRSLRPFPLDDAYGNLVLGQYGPGEVDGKPAAGYLDEEGVAAGSLTPTFAMMRIFIDNWRWQGVPFYVTSGKRLGAKLTEIMIRFKDVPITMFREILGNPVSANVLTLGIQPQEKISLSFQTKTPGDKILLRPVTMNFDFLQGYSGPVLAAYERGLLDCMQGEKMLFLREDEIDLTWTYLDPIINECEVCSDRADHLKGYEAGTWGPPEAVALKKLMHES